MVIVGWGSAGGKGLELSEGVLGLAFHPDYESNGRFFVRYSVPREGGADEPCFDTTRGCHSEVLGEFAVSDDPNVADPAGSILFSVDEPEFNHKYDWQFFLYDGRVREVNAWTHPIDPEEGAVVLIEYTSTASLRVPAEQRGKILVKNPAGFNQIIRLLADIEPSSVLIAINDLDADGRDVSWLWDARLEDLTASRHRFGTSGLRAYDMGLRLKYADIEAWSEPDLGAALDRLVGSAAEGETVLLVPTYTAMLRLHSMLLPGTRKREAWT